MVKVKLYKDMIHNTDEMFIVEDADPNLATHRGYGWDSMGEHESYYCPKKSWKKYLLKLLSTKDIDKEISKLQKKKKKIEELKAKITKEIEEE